MSLCLLDQRLGSRSAQDASSHKFSLKGRQSGGIHRGHSWVFRAESYDTMMAWYEDIRNLTEKSGPERNEYVRRHARSVSAGSQSAPSVSSDGVDDDEADAVPYAASQPSKEAVESPPPMKRPSPGGRFPSDINIERVRDLHNAPSQSSGSSYQENEPLMTGAQPQTSPIARTRSRDRTQAAEHLPSTRDETQVLPTTSQVPDERREISLPNRQEETLVAKSYIEQKDETIRQSGTNHTLSMQPDPDKADPVVANGTVIEEEDAQTSSTQDTDQFVATIPRHRNTGELHVPGGWTNAKES